MSRPTVVIDTNVLVSALRSSAGASHRLIQLVDEGELEIGLTAPLVLEYEAVCKRMVGPIPLTAEEIDQVIDYLCQIGKRCAVHFRVRPSLGDPDDEMVLEAAIAAGAEWIVTYNIRDLLAGAERYGVEIVTPAEALRRMGVVP